MAAHFVLIIIKILLEVHRNIAEAHVVKLAARGKGRRYA